MIDVLDRELLREQAVTRWNEVKRLRHDAVLLKQRTAELRGRFESQSARFHELRQGAHLAQERARAEVERARKLSEDAAALVGTSSQPMVFEHLVDQAIELSGLTFLDDRLDEGVALVGSADMGELVRMKDLANALLPCTFGAVDAPTVLGLTMTLQPDLAVIDADLDISSGADVVLTFPLYAPQTKALVLTDDPERSRDLRIVGFETQPRDVSDSSLLAWIARSAA